MIEVKYEDKKTVKNCNAYFLIINERKIDATSVEYHGNFVEFRKSGKLVESINASRIITIKPL